MFAPASASGFGSSAFQHYFQIDNRPSRDFSAPIRKYSSVKKYLSDSEVDADDLDDDQLLEALLESDDDSRLKDVAAGSQFSGIPDWPSAEGRASSATLVVDPETTAWFQARHADWQGEMLFVLRAWVLANRGCTNAPPPV